MGIKDGMRLAAACGACLAVGLSGSLATRGAGFAEWYATLEKPVFTPPGWVFGPVWTALYLLMGVSAFLVWRRGPREPAVRVALGWFVVQLVLNALWSPAFFGLRRIELGLVVVAGLAVALGVTMYCFARVSRAAAWLLVPYLVWVVFAAVLNAVIWCFNR